VPRHGRRLLFSPFPSDNAIETSRFIPGSGADLPKLKSVEVSIHCQQSARLNLLLDWIWTRERLELHELKLHPPFASKTFLVQDWSSVHYHLTTLIVNGRELREPVDILPHFKRLELFHAQHLPLPDYEVSTDLPLVQTLRHLHLEATSIQWIGGREFGRLEHCTITLPRRQQTIEPVGFPACKDLAFDGHPLRTLALIRVFSVETMLIRSHDTDQGRLDAFLAQIQTGGEIFSMIRSLHLGIRCSQRAMVNAFHCMNSLEELTLSLQHPSDIGRALFHALRAKRSLLVNSIATQDRWSVDLLPSLTSLRLHYVRGHRSDADYEAVPFVRAVAWSRKQTASPLRELRVWAGTRTAVDYASTDYFREHLGMEKCCHHLDTSVCTSTLTQELTIYRHSWCCLTKLLGSKLDSSTIFSRLKILDISVDLLSLRRRINLSDLKELRRIKILRVTNVVLDPVPPDTRLPLFQTLREIYLKNVPTAWMSGHIFMNLTTLSIVISVYDARYQEFYFNAGQGRNPFPSLCTFRLLTSAPIFPTNWAQNKIDQLVHIIWGGVEVRKTEYEEDGFHVLCTEGLPS
jgi:hypothetical protein